MADQGLRFGVQIGNAGSRTGWLDAARAAEKLGYDTLLVPDHIFPVVAPLSALGAAAAATDRIRLGTLLLNNDFRHPVVLAHEAATLDVLSAGRLELGIGAGWNRKEFDEAGIPFDEPRIRVDRLIESVSIIGRLLSGETLDFRGDHYTVTNHQGLTPVQRPRPTLVVGGNGDRVLSLAARQADVVNFLGMTVRSDGTRDFSSFTRDGFARKLDLVTRAASDRRDSVELSVYVWNVRPGTSAVKAAATIDRDPSLTLEDIMESPFALAGTPAEMAEKILRIRAVLGISYWIVPYNAMADTAAVINELR